MPPKTKPPDTPSPAKKRKTESTPVKHGVDFFFKRQATKTTASKLANGNQNGLFVRSDGEEDGGAGEWERRRRQEEEDERLARELQEMEGRQEVDDEELARRLAKDYEDAGNESETKVETNGAPHLEEEDIYGTTPPQKAESTDLPVESTATPIEADNPPRPLFQPVTGKPPPTPLEEIYSIPLDNDPLQFNPVTDAPCASTWSGGHTPYAFLTHSFILINSTRSRLKIVDYLVNTLRVVTHHDPASLLPVVWLTTNAIAPPFENIELNLGGSVISKALVSASGLNNAALKALYDKWGDVGDVAFEAKLAVRTLVKPTPLSVRGVYSVLREIARAKGQGSAETKRRLVERLLVSARGEEVRYIGRTLVQHV